MIPVDLNSSVDRHFGFEKLLGTLDAMLAFANSTCRNTADSNIVDNIELTSSKKAYSTALEN